MGDDKGATPIDWMKVWFWYSVSAPFGFLALFLVWSVVMKLTRGYA